MFYKYEIEKYFILMFLLINIYKCIYLNSGIESLNKFLYSSRLSQYYQQNQKKACSISDGPNCYFTENDYTKHYKQTNNENKTEKINNEWVELYSKIPKNRYKNIMNNFANYTANYINLYSKKIDTEQNSQNNIFQVLVNFDSFDDETIKHDIYLEEKKGMIFFNEEIIVDIKGRLRLSYDKILTEKDINIINKDYPSKTYGIIESDYISISFRGNLFICNYLYLKKHNKISIDEQIFFYGYLKEKLIFSYGFTDNQKRKEKWIKATFPLIIPIDKLLISGYYDIDNIFFTFPNPYNVDHNEVYKLYNYKSIKMLISNEDI